MNNTKVIPARDLRNSYAEVVGMLEEHSTVIITNRGRSESVLIPFADYQDYEEYLHYRYVREKLCTAERYAAMPDAKWFDDADFWEAIEAD